MKRRDFLKLSAVAALTGAAGACGAAPAASASSIPAAPPASSPAGPASSAAPAGAASLTTNEGDAIPLEALEHLTRDAGAPAVLFYPGDQRGGAGAGLRGPGLDAVGPGGGQAVHRGAPRLQLSAA